MFVYIFHPKISQEIFSRFLDEASTFACHYYNAALLFDKKGGRFSLPESQKERKKERKKEGKKIRISGKMKYNNLTPAFYLIELFRSLLDNISLSFLINKRKTCSFKLLIRTHCVYQQNFVLYLNPLPFAHLFLPSSEILSSYRKTRVFGKKRRSRGV